MSEPCLDCGTPTELRGNRAFVHECYCPDPASCPKWELYDESLCQPCQDLQVHQKAHKLGMVVTKIERYG